MRRALVVGSGGPGPVTYSAVIVAELCDLFGPSYFDAMYACSASAHAITFAATGQLNTIKHTWLNHCPGFKLINPFNPVRGRKILDLDYMVELYQDERAWLDIDAVFSSGIQLRYVLTDYETGDPVYFCPNKGNIFDAMVASSAVPFVHGGKKVDGKVYLDGAISDPFPVARALADGWDEVIAVCLRPETSQSSYVHDFAWNAIAQMLPKRFTRRWASMRAEEEAALSDRRVKVIRPEKNLPIKFMLDPSKRRWRATYDIGLADFHKFVQTLKTT